MRTLWLVVPIMRRHVIVSVACILSLSMSDVRAETSSPLSLNALYQHAGTVFRGTVLRATPGELHAGGGILLTTTYRIRVDESFKGEFSSIKGIRYTDVQLVEGIARVRPDGSRGAPRILSAMPHLQAGQPYLLLVTRPSAIGTSAPVGLGQGLFRITSQPGGEQAVNSTGNVTLFSDASARPTAGVMSKGLKSSVDTPTAVRPSIAQNSTRYAFIADRLRQLAAGGAP